MAVKKSLRCMCFTGLFIFLISFVLLVHLQAQTRDKAAGPEKETQQAEQVKKEEGLSNACFVVASRATSYRKLDGSIREYPWATEKGEPNPNIANFANNVGTTTPVGRYPEGATPHGLMDMAGNVWEWMENFVEGKYPALRGGSWSNSASYLRCFARSNNSPDVLDSYFGSRVLRSTASSLGSLRS